MYAIVDIETTGGYANGNGITEIAIAIHDGEQMIDYFETLINPQVPIPRYIQSLTGISHAMVSQAPAFVEVASKIYHLLNGKVFVAHNVNFDYSFLKHHLEQAGFQIDCKKLCTVRLARKVLPGFLSYSLGKLCNCLNIEIEQRHRAGGDTKATVKLFEEILKADVAGEVQLMLKGRSKDQHLPPNLPVQKVEELPRCPGVYYFHNQKGKVVYVGKAKDLRKRVTSHFANNKTGKQKQEFLREIHNISYEICGTELMAFILESVEIKRLWPLYNRSMKGPQQVYALYSFEDGRGYHRLAIEKKKKHLQCIHTFNAITEGIHLLKHLIDTFQLCPKLCFIDTVPGPSLADEQNISVNLYNERVQKAVAHLKSSLPSFALVEEVDVVRKGNKQTVILMENGRFYGMGYLPDHISISSLEQVKPHITPYPENDYIRGLIYQHAGKYPEKKIEWVA